MPIKGRYRWELSGEKNLEESRQYLQQAVAADPGYALAWAGLADTYNALVDWGVDSSEVARPQARAAAERALDLDSSLVGPLVTLAEVKMDYEWDWAGAERLCQQVVALAPNYGSAHDVYATLLAEIGRTRDAVAEARRAREVEPLSPRARANVVWKLYLARQYDEAELDAQKYRVFTGYVQASVRLQTGRTSEAVADLKRAVAEWGHGVPELTLLAHGLGVTGARAEGQKVLQELLGRKYVPPDWLGIAYEGLGEREQALQCFEKGYAERSMHGWFIPDPRLDQIRQEPRFQAILRKICLPQQTSSDPIPQ
jgi:tetratricopeptide (TPR) repeat protein